MPNGTRRRKSSQIGVQAIFSVEDRWTVKTATALGVVLAAGGGGLWAWLLVRGASSLTLLSLSLLLVMVGVASGSYALSVRHGRKENDRIRSALYELEILSEPRIGLKAPDPEPEEAVPMKDGSSSPHRFSKTLALALAEAVLLIIVYTGLVEEYTSNANMQRWVHTNISLGAYVLSFNAIYVLVGTLVATILFRLLFGKQN